MIRNPVQCSLNRVCFLRGRFVVGASIDNRKRKCYTKFDKLRIGKKKGNAAFPHTIP